jgi:hypothetical protein
MTEIERVLLERASQRLRDQPGYLAYDLAVYEELTGQGATECLRLDAEQLTYLALCRSPRRDRRFGPDVAGLAAYVAADPVALADLVRTADALTMLLGAPSSTRGRGLLAAARDAVEQAAAPELPPTGTDALPRWLQRAVDIFWSGVDPPSGFPRDLELAVLCSLPVALVEIQGLGVATISSWLAERHLPALPSQPDRGLRGCLLAYAGVALIFVDRADTAAERRGNLAHEAGHLLLDYLLPRQEIMRRRPELLEVVDGDRAPTHAEQVEALIAHLPIGVHTHLMERTASDGHLQPDQVEAEERAQLVAWELLAPQVLVFARVEREGATTAPALQALLEDEFGLPQDTASAYGRYLGRLRPPPGQSFLGRLGLADHDQTER